MYASPRQRCPVTDQRQAGVNDSFVRVYSTRCIYAATVRLGHISFKHLKMFRLFHCKPEGIVTKRSIGISRAFVLCWTTSFRSCFDRRIRADEAGAVGMNDGIRAGIGVKTVPTVVTTAMIPDSSGRHRHGFATCPARFPLPSARLRPRPRRSAAAGLSSCGGGRPLRS